MAFGLWDPNFTTQFGLRFINSGLTVVAATPTATVPVSTYTPTTVPTPSGSAIVLNTTGPAGGTTVNAGSAFTVSYSIYNTTGSSRSVKLVARLSPSGFPGRDNLTDMANETTVTIPPGSSSFTRSFQVPSDAGEGSYDLTWSLVDASNNNVLTNRTGKNQLWISVPGQVSSSLFLNGSSLSTSSITLQSGNVNYITGTFTINNTSGFTSKVLLRMKMRLNGTTNWITDVPGDKLVTLPTGSSVVTRTFAIPLYFATGSYDVIWEIGDAGFNGTLDNIFTQNALTISNPALVADKGVPILMYHNINPTNPSPSGNWVQINAFTQQMDYLANNGYNTITGDDLYNYIYRGTALPTNPVWLTFDDSYENVYDYAWPIMQARGLHGSIMAVTQYMGQMNSWDLGNEPQHLHMTWSMLQAMDAGGMSADSHTQHHVRLTQSNYGQQQSEVWGTQRDLLSFANVVGNDFAYPYGLYNDMARWMLAHSGFQDGSTIVAGTQHTDSADLYQMKRTAITNSDNMTSFINKLTQP